MIFMRDSCSRGASCIASLLFSLPFKCNNLSSHDCPHEQLNTREELCTVRDRQQFFSPLKLLRYLLFPSNGIKGKKRIKIPKEKNHRKRFWRQEEQALRAWVKKRERESNTRHETEQDWVLSPNHSQAGDQREDSFVCLGTSSLLSCHSLGWTWIPFCQLPLRDPSSLTVCLPWDRIHSLHSSASSPSHPSSRFFISSLIFSLTTLIAKSLSWNRRVILFLLHQLVSSLFSCHLKSSLVWKWKELLSLERQSTVVDTVQESVGTEKSALDTFVNLVNSSLVIPFLLSVSLVHTLIVKYLLFIYFRTCFVFEWKKKKKKETDKNYFDSSFPFFLLAESSLESSGNVFSSQRLFLIHQRIKKSNCQRESDSQSIEVVLQRKKTKQQQQKEVKEEEEAKEGKEPTE